MAKCRSIFPYAGLCFLFNLLLVAAIQAQPGPAPLPKPVQTITQSFPDFIQQPLFERSELLGGQYYRLLHFDQLPELEEQEILQQTGIQLLEYMADNRYLVAIAADLNPSPIQQLSIEQISQLTVADKWAPSLLELLKSQPTNQLDLLVQYQSNLKPALIRHLLAELDAEILRDYTDNHVFRISLPSDRLSTLAQLPAVRYLEDFSIQHDFEDLSSINFHRSNILNTQFKGGRKYDGQDVHVVIADDGFIGPHIDFKGRTLQSAVIGSSSGNHGEVVAGILSGAGNLDPTKQGVAPGAILHIVNSFDPINISNAAEVNSEIVITSNSYGEGCNRGYTIFAQSTDKQSRERKNILHIFSAGNAGQQDCGYGAGVGWGTITGGSKMAKNVLTIGNVTQDDKVVESSSRGPASDGRIKPDLCANGDGQLTTAPNNNYITGSGSSAAAPVVAGVAAQLYQAYRKMNNGEDPPSALIKACLLNTAEDLGTPGPDFLHGWGRVNAFKALDILEQRRYRFGEMPKTRETIEFQIPISSQTKAARFMLYWHDQEGAPSAYTALVNDLDFIIKSPNKEVFNPWQLDPIGIGVVKEPAKRGSDHLNNVEQIVINDPSPGTYTVEVKGYSIPKGPQPFYLVYELLEEDLHLTFPIGGERLVPGKVTRIHWDARIAKENVTIEYANDKNGQWQSIGTSNGGKKYFDWLVPATEHGGGQIRISNGQSSSQSEVSFHILAPPTNLRVLEVCPGFTRLGWDIVENADAYIVYRLGNKYMDSLTIVSSNIAEITIADADNQNWYAVQSLTSNGIRSQRSVAVFDPHQLTDCVAQNDVGVLNIQYPNYQIIPVCSKEEIEVNVNIQNKGANWQRGFLVHYQLDQQAVVSEVFPANLPAGITFNYSFQTPLKLEDVGMHELRVWTTMDTDEVPYNDTILYPLQVLDGTSHQLPYFENFDTFDNCSSNGPCHTSCQLTNGWMNLSDQSTDFTDWRVHNGSTPSHNTGPKTDQNSGTEKGKYLYLEGSNSCNKKSSVLISPCLDLNGISQPVFTFWYHMNGQHMGELEIGLFDGKQWYNHIMPPIIGSQGSQWQKAVIELGAFSGKVVNIRFKATTGEDFLSDIAIDNIGVFDRAAPPVTNFTLRDPISCHNQAIYFLDNSFNNPTAWLWSFTPTSVEFLEGTSAASPNPVVRFLESRNYQVQLSTTNSYGTHSIETVDNFIQFTNRQSLPVVQHFNDSLNNQAIPWQVFNPDDKITWSYVDVIGVDGKESQAIYMDNHGYNAEGASDEVISEPIDLTQSNHPILQFDFSYAAFDNSHSDELRIEIIDVCDPSIKETIYHKSGAALATTTNQSQGWKPTSTAHWKQEYISLKKFTGTAVLVKFNNICGYGNNLYLDNITIAELKDLPNSSFIVTPIQSDYCPDDEIQLINTTLSSGNGDYQYNWFINEEDTTYTIQGFGPHDLQIGDISNKTISLLVSNQIASSLVHFDLNTTPWPEAAFTYEITQNGDIQFFNNSDHAKRFLWNFGDGNNSTSFSPIHRYQKNKIYSVQLKATNNCGDHVFVQELEISTSLLPTPSTDDRLRLFPNPANQSIKIDLPVAAKQAIDLQIVDITGKTLLALSQLQANQNGLYTSSISQLPAGAYLVKAQVDQQIYTSKLIVSPR